MMAESSEKVCCVPCFAKCEDFFFVRTPLQRKLSREALEPHAHVLHVRETLTSTSGT